MVCARKADKKGREAMRKTVKPRSIYSKGKASATYAAGGSVRN